LLLKLFHKIEKDGILPNSFEANINPTPNNIRTHKKRRKLLTKFLDEHRCKNSQ
jgi:hypothetical protein